MNAPHDDESAEVRKRMWEKLAKSPFIMIKRIGTPDHAEPMTAILDPEADGAFWLYTRKDNRIATGGPAMAQVVTSDHKLFACIRGNLVPETDPALIEKYWSNMVEAWFEGGRADPALLMLRFELEDAEIWEGDESLSGKFKMITGMKIKPEEAGRHVETTL
ncbi:MAG: pyridoxamine 5'-phosphate oxidase family protein [Sphingomonas sp.]|uniref:pyridoxamine 5'-phosphate oxidase family protein n=1 Tax=Sphingomonas sp. TaxID=28214 RepID=UPI001AFE5B9E|nr:pyridoxamine 5'-phosphate oxidase family protein [Sphingomonas sp.]MBO9624046.1 pyridoxamine 5'-phosphate oxidase family protein [Sphingomonas sp.]